MKDCLLCSASRLIFKEFSQGKYFYECKNCGLIVLAPELRLSSEAERARYELHKNDSQDPAYREFLNRIVSPLSKLLTTEMQGLDYGCGPGPAISEMLGEKGIKVDNYDPYFFPRIFKESDRFDFITCTEVVEHFYNPASEFKLLAHLTRPQGLIAVMTEIYDPLIPFQNWWYAKDPTHVAIYQDRTFEWIANFYNWKIYRPHRNVRIFQ